MGIVSQIYLLLFLPLITALFCQIFSKKNLAFIFAVASCSVVLLLLLSLFPDIITYQKITNDFALAPLSIALEFNLDLLAIIFLTLLLFLKIVTLLFYHSDIENQLNARNNRIFYSVFLLNIFSLIGIFTTNNLLNLFIFFELYSFSFFAILSISRDIKLLQLAFRYFCLNSASSLLLLFCFFAIYLVFGEFDFAKISQDLSLLLAFNPWFLVVIFVLLSVGLVIKFFPFWLYFEKLKSSNPIANFFAIESLFVKTNIGVFLILKFIHLLFGLELFLAKIHLDSLFLILAIALIFYSAFKIYFQKHLKIIVAYLILNNLGFIFAAILLRSVESLQSSFFYLLNLTLVNLFIFIFATFLKRHFKSSAINKIWLANAPILALPFKILLFFIAGFPLTILFFASWYIAYASLAFDLKFLLLSALIFSNFTYIRLALNLILPFFSKNLTTHQNQLPELEKSQYYFYIASFWLLVIAIYSTIFAAGFLNSLSLRFASYIIMF